MKAKQDPNLLSLIDGAYDVVDLHKAETPSSLGGTGGAVSEFAMASDPLEHARRMLEVPACEGRECYPSFASFLEGL